jgi:dolichol-phosphate mannosyltransferase
VAGLKGEDSTLIIPVLNEAGAIREVLSSLERAVPGALVIVADDGSTDGTRGLVAAWAREHPGVRLLERNSDRGLTASVLAALANVSTGNVAVMDGDGQHPVELVARLLDSLGSASIAVGVRRSYASLGMGRKLLSRAGNALARAGSRRQGGAVCSDMLSGLFAVRTAHFQNVVSAHGKDFERSGFKVLFDLLRFSPASIRIAELPFELSSRREGSSKMNGARMGSFMRQLGPAGRLLAPAFTSRFLRFSLVGGSGVFVNSAVFLALLLAGLGPLPAAAVSAETALLWNFALNDRWTWGRSTIRWPVRLGRYHVVGIIGIAVNLGVLALLVPSMPALPANLLGILAAVVWGFLANDRWTWATVGEPRPPILSDRKAMYLLSFVIQCVLAALFIHDWDGFVFERSARDLLLGGVSPYQTAVSAPPYIFNMYDVPPIPEWYAYPPLPLLMFGSTYGLGLLVPFSSPAFLRLCLKLPFIFGNLLLARVSARLVGNDKALSRTELFLLFNPFLIFIGAVWGMFDSLMVLFMIASLLMIRRKRPAMAGAAFGAAALLKLFPVFFLPAVLFWAQRRTGNRGAGRFLATAGAVVAGISLPFFLQSPDGFFRQVFWVHLQRPPQGISLVGLPYYMNYLNDLLGLSLPQLGLREVSLLSIAFLAPSLVLAYLVAYRARKESDILFAFAGIAFALMLFNKVVNEQYLVLPLVLAYLYGKHRGSPSAPALASRRIAIALTAGGTVAGIVIGFHFLTFIPPDTAALGARIFGTFSFPGNSLVSQRLLFIIPAVVAAIAVAPAWILMMGGVEEVGRRGARELRASVRRLVGPVPGRRRVGAAASVFTVLLLLAPAAGSALLLPGESTREYPALEPIRGPMVGAYYYLWWNNPTHNPSMREGNWKDVSQEPAAGYYTNTPAYMIRHIRQMKQAKIDFAIVSYHGYDSQELLAFARVCRMEGMRFAVMMEVGAVSVSAGTPQYGYPLNSASHDEILSMARAIPKEVWRSSSFCRFEGRPLLFAYDAFFAIAARGESRDLNRSFAGFWFSIRESLEKQYGPLFLVAGLTGEQSHQNPAPDLLTTAPFDSVFVYSPAFAWAAHRSDSTAENMARWEARQADLAVLDRTLGFPVILSVMPAYDDTVLRQGGFSVPSDFRGRLIYDTLWEDALARSPDILSVTSWNEFFEGTAIEPSVQYGDLYLERTGFWSARLKEGSGIG